MQEYRKLLCVNKIRETKRLIENMLIPIVFGSCGSCCWISNCD